MIFPINADNYDGLNGSEYPSRKVCPICGDEFVHLMGVEVNAGGVITKVDGDGTCVFTGSPAGRGSNIKIRMACEFKHHTWYEELQFHKGETFCQIQEEIKIQTGLWRD